MKIIIFIFSYLLGSVPTGVILTRGKGADIRKAGSGNIGATNVYRLFGRKLGIITFLGDMLKGLIPVLIGRLIGLEDKWLALVGLAAFLGHLYPVFSGFSGGKGVSTALGVLLAINPAVAGGSLTVWIAVLMIRRYASLSSLCGAASAPIFMWLISGSRHFIALTLLFAFFVYYSHRENIKRLIEGAEKKL